MAKLKLQRLRDPIHDLVAFRAEDKVDQLAWRLINTREFQRLRRIRQLGFSELVFPGATHTRFSHCVGVFHLARRLLSVIERKKIKGFDKRRATAAACAALLHDLGHGPFSHAFEEVEKNRGVKKSHETWTAEAIQGDTEVRRALDGFRRNLATEVGQFITEKEPKDIYASVVSSQFDADRLDYLQRDRYMTGTATGGIDVEWLLDCLEVGRITMRAGKEVDYVEVDGFYLNQKGLPAAEEYLLARFHLYAQVYTHKTTRATERMLAALLTLLAHRINEGMIGKTGLSDKHPLVRYYRADSDLQTYLALDDGVIWTALAEMARAKDRMIASLAGRLHGRQLYKCFDVEEPGSKGDALPRFHKSLKEEAKRLELEDGITLLSDEARISAYGVYRFEEPGALQKVLIANKKGGKPEDIAD